MRRVGHYCEMTPLLRRCLTCLLGSTLALGLFSCSSKPSKTGSQEDLRKTAQAYAQAWLVGSANDIAKSGGQACAPRSGHLTPGEQKTQTAFLRRIRANIESASGVKTDEIKIRKVAVRSYTGTKGEAEVQYDLPTAVAGNYNWIPYAFKKGHWRVSDCTLLPIGGQSDSATAYPTTVP
jgi:hypothetical protein